MPKISDLTYVKIRKETNSKVKIQAAIEGKTIQDWIDQALNKALKEKKK